MFCYYHSGRHVKLVGSYKDPKSYRLTICDQDLENGTGESRECGKVIGQEEFIYRIAMNKAKLLTMDSIIKTFLGSILDVPKEIIKGFFIHITEYFGYFTYPPNIFLTISSTC